MITTADFLTSLITIEGVNSLEKIKKIIEEKNKNIKVKINKIPFNKCEGWFLDENGIIRNHSNSFFQISGIQYELNLSTRVEQPIIIQNEIGYLGIVVKKINGILHFLMQAKIEPGNINKVQISPTIQATKSNFEQKHGGKKPAYLDIFLNASNFNVVVDQIQSEQSSRFLGKRNRNIIVDIGDYNLEILDSHFWLTLGQIKQLMKIDNLVNMDTRTVLSCIPFWSLLNWEADNPQFNIDKYLINSIVNMDSIDYVDVFRKINNFKMFNSAKRNLVSLNCLNNWVFNDYELRCKDSYSFKVIFCELSIDGREVKHWCQPLFEATGKALFALFCTKVGDKYEYLVRLTSEIGTFDTVELGPTIQCEGTNLESFYQSELGSFFLKCLNKKSSVKNNVILSEEGGRFYHEENMNVVLEVNKDDLKFLNMNEYAWVDFKTLNFLVQFNNVLNIQLRNLLSILGVSI